MREKLNRGDWIFVAVCGVIFAAGLAIGIRYFDKAFPEASINFKYNRGSSRPIAEELLNRQKLSRQGYRHASEFEHDDTAKIFLERKLGLEKVNELSAAEVRIWYWRHRWFKPLQIEEMEVAVAPTGEVVAFVHRIPEDQAAPSLDAAAERTTAEAFLRQVGVAPEQLNFVSRSEQKLPKRVDVTYVWESRATRPADAPYRYRIRLQGNEVGSFSQFLDVPDQWLREYQELRSKNIAAAVVDQVFLAITVIAALVVFILRLRHGDVKLRFALGTGLIGAALWVVVSWNEFPSALANYDTATSYPAFLAQQILLPILIGMVMGVFLSVIVGSGESLYRQRLPGQLSMTRVFSRSALTSKRVFLSLILGYTLFAGFLAYQVLFYLGASYFGAWAPAEIPYTSILNSAFPWAAVLFMGFFPAVSEEFMSRAFSIPFFERILRSRVTAIVLAGFIWGFGHVAYPNQPFFIRGIEVGVAGVIMGFLMYRWGLLGLLLWHYTVDALYTSFLLLRSGNPYYMFSAGLASLIFVVPAVIAVVLYIRNKGFIPDEDLTNAAVGTELAPAVIEEEAPRIEEVVAPTRIGTTAWIALAVSLTLAVAAVLLRGPALSDIINYRISKQRAVDLARRHLAELRISDVPERVVSIADPGFRWWNPNSRREDGGNPGGYDVAAVEYLKHNERPPVERILEIKRSSVEAATWMVRLFTPGEKNEIFVEIDPRTSRAVGMHQYREEDAPGPSLERAAAEGIAVRELQRYQLQPAEFELKEALVFQQPKRRDWVLHYQERKPLAAEAFRRATVRVSGDRVSQFAKTVRIPERARRDFEEEGILNTILLIARILAAITLLGLVIYGVVSAARDNRFAWKIAMKISLFLSPLAIISVLLQREVFLSQYDTAMPWETFSVVMIVGLIFGVAFQLGMTWLAIAVIETILPAARRVLAGAGARRFGAAAAVAALTVLSIVVVWGSLQRSLPRFMPDLIRADGLGVSELVSIPLPALAVLWQAVLMTVTGCAAVAGFVAALRATPPNRRMVIHGVAVASLLLAGLDSSLRPAQLPVAILLTAVGIAIVYAVVRYLLRDNLLAYPLTFFCLALGAGIATLMQNDRSDLLINAAVLLAIGVAALTWYGLRPVTTKPDSLTGL